MLNSSERVRTRRLTLLIGIGLIATILVVAILSGLLLRDQETELWKKQMANLSLVVAEHAYQSMSSANLALESIADRIHAETMRDADDLRRRAATAEIHAMLRDKISGLPQADVATVVAANGDVINFTRSFPAPAINLAERDYFKIRRDHPEVADFISLPVRNKGNGKWVFYLSKRLENAQGQFIGMVLVGISVDGFTNFYQRLGENLGDGASVSLSRRDFSLLTRWPRRDEQIGSQNRTGANFQVIENQQKRNDVIFIDTPRQSDFGHPTVRLAAVRLLERYPLIVNVTLSDAIFLESWRRTVRTIAGLAGGSCLILAVGLVMLLKLLKRREEAQAALVRYSTEIEDLYRNAPCGYHSLDSDGRFLRCNDTELHWLGYGRDDVVGCKLFSELLTEDSRRIFALNFPLLKAQGWIKDVEMELVRKDGSVLPVILSSTAIRDEQGRYLASRTTVFDQTERKRLARRERARTAILEKMARGMALSEVLAAIIHSVEAEHEGWQGSVHLLTKDSDPALVIRGATCNEQGLTEPITDSAGALVGHFAIQRSSLGYHAEEGIPSATDIVVIQQAAYLAGIAIEQHRANQEIQDLNTSLEQRVKARTEELLCANAELERANAELESFSYSTSHDLRAPLRAINGYARVLLDTEYAQLSQDGRHMLDRIAHNANRLGDLIDDILSYARAGRRPLNREAVDLTALVTSLADELRESFSSVAFHIAPLPQVRGDPTMLHQILQNLMHNACKFSALRDQPEVSIGVSPSANGDNAPAATPTFFVRDNGIGYDMQYATKLFTMFEQLHADKQITGSGVGLAIVKRLVERHGGRIWAEAMPNQGACFYFTLPDGESDKPSATVE